jgi:hypothetical protein
MASGSPKLCKLKAQQLITRAIAIAQQAVVRNVQVVVRSQQAVVRNVQVVFKSQQAVVRS